jgi:hypothetical protein
MLQSELSTWIAYKSANNLNESLKTINSVRLFFNPQKNLKNVFPNLFILLKIFLTVPVSSCEAERSFSALKRILTWLRSTMSQDRLSSLTLIQMNSKELVKLDIEKMIDWFDLEPIEKNNNEPALFCERESELSEKDSSENIAETLKTPKPKKYCKRRIILH